MKVMNRRADQYVRPKLVDCNCQPVGELATEGPESLIGQRPELGAMRWNAQRLEGQQGLPAPPSGPARPVDPLLHQHLRDRVSLPIGEEKHANDGAAADRLVK